VGAPIVLFEVLTASILREHLPLGAFERFRRSVAAQRRGHQPLYCAATADSMRRQGALPDRVQRTQ
jgi:hypothetical protein